MAEKIFVMVGQDPAAAQYAQQYITIIIPGIVMFGLFDTSRQYLNSMGKSTIPMII